MHRIPPLIPRRMDRGGQGPPPRANSEHPPEPTPPRSDKPPVVVDTDSPVSSPPVPRQNHRPRNLSSSRSTGKAKKDGRSSKKKLSGKRSLGSRRQRSIKSSSSSSNLLDLPETKSLPFPSSSRTSSTRPHIASGKTRNRSRNKNIQSALHTIPSTAAVPSPREARKLRPKWVSDRDAPFCGGCAIEFTVRRRKHHCRSCGQIFCESCSNNRIAIPSLRYTREVRVCDKCWLEHAGIRSPRKRDVKYWLPGLRPGDDRYSSTNPSSSANSDDASTMDDYAHSSADEGALVSTRPSTDHEIWLHHLDSVNACGGPKETKVSLEALGLHRVDEWDDKFHSSPLPMLVARHDPLAAALSGDETFDVSKLKEAARQAALSADLVAIRALTAVKVEVIDQVDAQSGETLLHLVAKANEFPEMTGPIIRLLANVMRNRAAIQLTQARRSQKNATTGGEPDRSASTSHRGWKDETRRYLIRRRERLRKKKRHSAPPLVASFSFVEGDPSTRDWFGHASSATNDHSADSSDMAFSSSCESADRSAIASIESPSNSPPAQPLPNHHPLSSSSTTEGAPSTADATAASMMAMAEFGSQSLNDVCTTRSRGSTFITARAQRQSPGSSSPGVVGSSSRRSIVLMPSPYDASEDASPPAPPPRGDQRAPTSMPPKVDPRARNRAAVDHTRGGGRDGPSEPVGDAVATAHHQPFPLQPHLALGDDGEEYSSSPTTSKRSDVVRSRGSLGSSVVAGGGGGGSGGLLTFAKESISRRGDSSRAGGSPFLRAGGVGSSSFVLDTIDHRDANDNTALHLAVMCGNLHAMLALMQCGADTGRLCASGGSALHLCCLHAAKQPGCVDVATVLLEHGADPNVLDQDGNTALHVICKLRIFKGSLGEGGSPPQLVGLMRCLLAHDADPSVGDAQGRTPLHHAAHGGSFDLAKVLVGHGVQVNCPDGDGNNPIHLAVGSGTIGGGSALSSSLVDSLNGEGMRSTIRLLASACALALVTCNAQGRSPLDLCTHRETRRLLLHYVSQSKDAAVAKETLRAALLQADEIMVRSSLAKLHECAAAPSNAASTSIEGYFRDVLLARIQSHHHHHRRHDEEGSTTMLHIAASIGDADIMQCLLARIKPANQARGTIDPPVDPSEEPLLLPRLLGDFGNTVVHAGASGGSPEVVSMLVGQPSGEDVEGRGPRKPPIASATGKNHAGDTPMHVACHAPVHHHRHGRGGMVRHKSTLDVIRVLLKAGANVDARGANGWTPLHAFCHRPRWNDGHRDDSDSASFGGAAPNSARGSSRRLLKSSLTTGSARKPRGRGGRLGDAGDGRVDPVPFDDGDAGRVRTHSRTNSDGSSSNLARRRKAMQKRREAKRSNIPTTTTPRAPFGGGDDGDARGHAGAGLRRVPTFATLRNTKGRGMNAFRSTPNLAALDSMKMVEHSSSTHRRSLETEHDESALLEHFSAAEMVTYHLLHHAHASTRICDVEGRTPLHLAAAAGNWKLCRLLVDVGRAHVDARDCAGNTPLHCAAKAFGRLSNDVSQSSSISSELVIVKDSPRKGGRHPPASLVDALRGGTSDAIDPILLHRTLGGSGGAFTRSSSSTRARSRSAVELQADELRRQREKTLLSLICRNANWFARNNCGATPADVIPSAMPTTELHNAVVAHTLGRPVAHVLYDQAAQHPLAGAQARTEDPGGPLVAPPLITLCIRAIHANLVVDGVEGALFEDVAALVYPTASIQEQTSGHTHPQRTSFATIAPILKHALHRAARK